MSDSHTPRSRFRLFDIRNIIGALLGIYGVLLTVAGVFPQVLGEHSAPDAAGNRTDLYVGTDANWWVGVVLLAVAAVFFAWAILRPVEPEELDQTHAIEDHPREP